MREVEKGGRESEPGNSTVMILPVPHEKPFFAGVLSDSWLKNVTIRLLSFPA